MFPIPFLLFPPVFFLSVGINTTIPRLSPIADKPPTTSGCFLVEKIDSVTQQVKIHGSKNDVQYGGVYLLYVRQDTRLYKLVSERSLTSYRRCISVGQCYSFQLESYFTPRPGEPEDLLGVPVGSIILNGALVVRDELASGELEDVYYDTRLKGLCFAKARDNKPRAKGT
jgi:hypothetical protein